MDGRTVWRLGVVFVLLNLALMVLGAAAAVFLGLWKGLALMILAIVFSVYLFYRFLGPGIRKAWRMRRALIRTSAPRMQGRL